MLKLSVRTSILEKSRQATNTAKCYLGTAIAESPKPENMVVKLFFEGNYVLM